MFYRETSQPAAEPVTLAQAKQQLVLDSAFTDDDSLIEGYITAARQYVEKRTNRAIYERNVRLTLDYFPLLDYDALNGAANAYVGQYIRALAIRLPLPGLVSVTTVKYLDSTGTPQTISPTTYMVDTMSEPGRVYPAPGYTWPYQNNYLPGQVIVDYTAGTYGEGVEVDNCPQTIKLAMLLLISHFYAHREATTEATLTNIPLGVAELLAGETIDWTF